MEKIYPDYKRHLEQFFPQEIKNFWEDGILKSPEKWQGLPSGTVVKNMPANPQDARDVGLIPGLGRFSGVGSDNPLQYSCLENPMDRRAWWAMVHRVAESWTRLSD